MLPYPRLRKELPFFPWSSLFKCIAGYFMRKVIKNIYGSRSDSKCCDFKIFFRSLSLFGNLIQELTFGGINLQNSLPAASYDYRAVNNRQFEISSIFFGRYSAREASWPNWSLRPASVKRLCNRRESAVVTLDKLFPSLRTEQPAIAEIMTDISVSLLNVFMVVRILVGRIWWQGYHSLLNCILCFFIV